jgi:hypothetical protein
MRLGKTGRAQVVPGREVFRGRPPATPGQIQELSKIIDLVKIQQYCSAQFPFDFYDP